MRLDLVIRTSHRKRDALSPDQQKRISTEFERRTGHQIVETHDSGRSESGKTMDRASLHEVRQRVRAGATEGVFVAYLDRLGRAPIEESMTFVRELVGDGGKLVAADWSDDAIDLTDPNVEDMLVFRLQMNRSMWNKAAERQKINKRDSLAAGKFIGPTPFGYAKDHGRLVPDEKWAPVVTRAYQIAAADGWQPVVTYLQQTAPNERIWRTDMVRKLLANRTYLGEHAKRGMDGYAGHQPLTDPDTFALAQHSPRGRQANGQYLLSGLVFCECGATLIGQHARNRARPNPDERRYRCQHGHVTASADDLDALVRDELRDALADANVRRRVMPAGIDEAKQAADHAAQSYRAFLRSGDPEDDDFAIVKAERKAARDKAQNEYHTLRDASRKFEHLPAADQIDDPVQLKRGLRILADCGLTIRLRRASRPPGPLADRVVWCDVELAIGELAA